MEKETIGKTNITINRLPVIIHLPLKYKEILLTIKLHIRLQNNTIHHIILYYKEYHNLAQHRIVQQLTTAHIDQQISSRLVTDDPIIVDYCIILAN